MPNPARKFAERGADGLQNMVPSPDGPATVTGSSGVRPRSPSKTGSNRCSSCVAPYATAGALQLSCGAMKNPDVQPSPGAYGRVSASTGSKLRRGSPINKGKTG